MITDTQIEEAKALAFRGTLYEEVRSYEVSLWTLQDEFITVLKWSDVENNGRIQDAKMTLNIDGTENLTFSIPMYIPMFVEQDRINPARSPQSSIKLIENPIWYTVANKSLMAGMRKIKVIFNKGKENEKVFEFVITKVDEKHENDSLICNVACEGLAFHELGKIGYRVNLSQDLFLLKYEQWVNNGRSGDEPIQNVQFWCEQSGLIPVPEEGEQKSTIWYYDIRMDHGSAGRDEERLIRSPHKVYEDEYTSEWNTNLTPKKIERAREKARPVEASNSNIYNITQSIAEAFEIYCKYEYKYDDNYHIISKTVVFYNNYLQEEQGVITLTYPYSSKSVTRTMECTDLVTKMYVTSMQDDTTLAGTASIMDTEINKTLEDYILNFDYLYQNNLITEEQYNEIAQYEQDMRAYNEQIIPLQDRCNTLEIQKPELEAKISTYKNSMALDQETIDYNTRLMNSIVASDRDTTDNYIHITEDNPAVGMIITLDDGRRVLNMAAQKKGIIESSVLVYTNFSSSAAAGSKLTNPVEGFTFTYDEYDNIEYMIGVPSDVTQLFMTYNYDPDLYFENIINSWKIKLANDTDKYNQYYDELYGTLNTSTGERVGGLIAALESAKSTRDTAIANKEARIKDFEHMMGPALREGYWQPENYTDYGDHKTVTDKAFTSIYNNAAAASLINDAGTGIAVGWDITPFEDEQKNYYCVGVTDDPNNPINPTYYPCVNLKNVWTQVQPYILDANISFVFNCNYNETTPGTDPLKYTKIFAVGSQAILTFIKRSSDICPVLLLIGADKMTDDEIRHMKNPTKGKPKLAIVTTNSMGETNIVDKLVLNSSDFITLTSNTPIVYPRIKFSTMRLKNNESDLVITYNNEILTRYEDYTVLTRNTKRNVNGVEILYPECFVTIKPEVMWRNGTYAGNLRVDYVLSNASIAIYLDAIEVLKESAWPKVSYEVDVNILSLDIINSLYCGLAQLVKINDVDLKLQNVFGYISQVNLDLDSPQNDKVEIKNYKTKFEDLFTQLVAQSEAMRRAAGGVSAAISGSVALNSNAISQTLNMNDLIIQAYLDSYFDTSEVVKQKLASLFTEASEILCDSNKLLSDTRALTIENAAILSSFAQNVAQELTGRVYRSATRPDNFKFGDTWLQTDPITGEVVGRYLATSDSEDASDGYGFTRTYDGTLAQIAGANLNVDAAKGLIDIEGQNYVRIRSGNNIYMAAGGHVDIVGNGGISIGGGEINLCSLYERNVDGTTGQLVEAKGINLIAGEYNSINLTNDTTSKVLLKPTSLLMAAANITMKGAGEILQVTSDGTAQNTSVVKINTTDGVWIGAGKGVRIFAPGTLIATSTSDGNYTITQASGASVDLNGEHLLLGFSNGSNNAAIELTQKQILIAKGDIVNATTVAGVNRKLRGVTGLTTDIIGISITDNSIGLATQSATTVNAILMNNYGITVGSSAQGFNLSQSTEALRNISNGSCVRINGEGIELNSLAKLYVNMDNFKLQTDLINDSMVTRFAVGNNLQYITTNNLVTGEISNTEPPLGNTSYPWCGLLFTNNNLYVQGTVYATAGSFVGAVHAQSFELRGDTAVTDFNNAVAGSTTIADVNATVFPIVHYGMIGYNATTHEYPTWNGNTYGLILGNNQPYPLLIGSNAGIQIVNVDGTNTAVTIDHNGIDITSGGYLKVDTTNLKINPEATGTNAVFQVGATNGSYIKYQGNGILDIKGNMTADSLTIGNNGATMSYDSTNGLNIGSGKLIYNNGTLALSGDITIGGQTVAGAISAAMATIGGWTIGDNRIYSTASSSYVALDSGTTNENYAIWAGNETSTSANFRVKRTGDVYLNALMVYDPDNELNTPASDRDGDYSRINFSGINFKQAVSLSLAWSGNKIAATARLWGKITKTEQKSIEIAGGITTAFGDGTLGIYNGYTTPILTLDGGSTYTVPDEQITCKVVCTKPMNDAWNDAASRVIPEGDSVDSDATTVTVPATALLGLTNTRTISLEPALTASYNSGFDDAEVSSIAIQGTPTAGAHSIFVTATRGDGTTKTNLSLDTTDFADSTFTAGQQNEASKYTKYSHAGETVQYYDSSGLHSFTIPSNTYIKSST